MLWLDVLGLELGAGDRRLGTPLVLPIGSVEVSSGRLPRVGTPIIATTCIKKMLKSAERRMQCIAGLVRTLLLSNITI